MWWPATVLVVATAILQSHAIPYWTDQAGLWGWLWSPGAELLAWWFLSRGGWSRVVGVVAAAVVVGGPLAQMTLPVVTDAQAEARTAESLESRIRGLTQDIEAATARARDHRAQAAELRHYSDGRHGRQVGLAQEAEEEASRLRERRRELQAKLGSRDHTGLSAPEHFHLGLHAGILIVAWLGSMTAVSALAHGPATRRTHAGTQGGAAHTGPASAGTEPTAAAGDPRRAEIARRLSRHMVAAKLTQQQVAEAAGIPGQRPEVSRALKERHGEPASPAADSVFEALEHYLEGTDA